MLKNYSEESKKEITPDRVDVFRLKERIRQEFEKIFPEIYDKISENHANVNNKHIMVPITEAQNRVNCVIQAM